MTQRFLHDTFSLIIPCACCGQVFGVQTEGHYYDESFVVDSVTNLHNGKEVRLNDEQRKVIELTGDERYRQARIENAMQMQEASN
jgi:hypothetical protein